MPTKPADLIISRARVFTTDADTPQAEAVAVGGTRIVFVGSAEEAQAWRGPATRVIDGQGCTLMPGFIDSHYHLLMGSLELGDAQLGEARSPEEMAAIIRAYADQHPDREWLIGRGLSYAILPQDNEQAIPDSGGSYLTRRHLDAIIPDRPLIVFAYDMHTAWANTPALERAGILSGGEAGPNSLIVMAGDGLASGELREPGAYNHIMNLIPPPDAARQRAALREGLALAASLGVTSVHNMDGDAEQLALYAALEDLGELTLRVYCPYSVRPDTPLEALAEAAALRDTYRSEMVRGGCVKFFMDGVVEGYTALLLDEYAGQPGKRGDANYSAEHFIRMATEADRLGLQVCVHAVGDGAVRRTLDGFEAVRRANGPRDSRHRIEHIELIHPDDLPRFAKLGVIASMQPLHAPLVVDGSDVWPERVGPQRWEHSFAWRALRQAGAHLVFGSDWPVASSNPLRGVYAALNRRPWAEGLTDQRQSLAETLLSYTRDAAYAEFQESRKGQLRPGQLADLVLLSEDIFSLPAEELERARPVLTVCNGRVVYEA